MVTLREFQYLIHDLVSKKLYSEALAYFKENKQFFLKEQISSNVFLVADMLGALRKTGAFAASHKFLEIYGIAIDEHTHERILTAYTLVWYDYYKSNDVAAGDSFWSGISTILPLIARVQSTIALNIYNLIVGIVLRSEAHRNTYNPGLLKRICEIVEPELLSTDCYVVEVERKGEKKPSELASVRENWYAQFSKSLFQLGEYDRCIAVCNEAFEKFDKLHYSNEIWFGRRIAQCMGKLGKVEEAIRSFEKLTRKKGDWFMIAELAGLNRQAGNIDLALKQMRQAMSLPGEFTFKVDLIEQLGDLYESFNDKLLAVDHYQLLYTIQKSEQWKIDPVIERKAGILCNEEEAWKLRGQLTRKLQAVWRMEISDAIGTGKIAKVGIPKEQGTDVWIDSDDGQKVYGFIKRTNKLHRSLLRGLKISFGIKPGGEGKLNIAVNIAKST